MKPRQYFNEWFSFSRSEKNGVIVLLILIVVVSVLHLFRGYFRDESISDFTEFETQITQMQMEMKNQASEKTQNTQSDSLVLFSFDPNTVSVQEFIKLGFSPKQAETLDKYRQKKGHFYSREDFRKLYFINDSLYNMYAPYIDILPEEKEAPVTESKKNYSKEEKQIQSVEINSADSALLESLPGIGPSFATRIIRYRDKLGGYSSVSQLMEVFGMTTETFEKVKNHVYTNPALIRKININACEFRDLIRHPYMDKQKVIRILDFRKVMKRVNNMDELVKNKIIDPSDSEKLIWYFDFE